jgi:hypothetical protein
LTPFPQQQFNATELSARPISGNDEATPREEGAEPGSNERAVAQPAHLIGHHDAASADRLSKAPAHLHQTKAPIKAECR